jgi:hypothetical protein
MRKSHTAIITLGLEPVAWGSNALRNLSYAGSFVNSYVKDGVCTARDWMLG